MIRLLTATGVQILANALGLLAAAAALDDMEVSGTAFVIAVLIFTVVHAIAQPLLTRMTQSRASALRGGVALVATLTGLVVTAAVSDGLSISGFSTWFMASAVVWAVSLLGVLLLPLVLVKRGSSRKHDGEGALGATSRRGHGRAG